MRAGSPSSDVLIIGGGCIGTATALQLLKADPDLDVVVLEPDPAYTDAASTRASGGVRQLFTRPENIQLSQYTVRIIGRWSEFLGMPGPDLAWRPNGYLFIATPELTDALRANLTTQRELGVRADWLEPQELTDRYPCLNTTDLGPAVLSTQDGWLDPHSFLYGMRAAARHLGAHYRTDRAVRLRRRGSKVTGVELAGGECLRAGAVVLAAGVGTPELVAEVGMPVPVEPMPRYEFYVETPAEIGPIPFIKDPDGLAVRNERLGFSVGLVDFAQPTGIGLPEAARYFEDAVWPALAHRIPALDRLKLRATWSGYYDQNRLDGNMIIGNLPGETENCYLATGFSGHGLMHAPGVGRALAELTRLGRYETIDLTRMGYQRVLDNEPYPELGIR